LKLKTKLFIKT